METAEQKAVAFHEKHKEYMRNYMKKSYAEHRDERIARSKEYYEAHKDDPATKARAKAYYEANKTKILARSKEMHRAFKEFKALQKPDEVV